MPSPGHPSPSSSVSASRIFSGAEAAAPERAELAQLAEEWPFTIVFNGVPFAVLMCTPADLEDLAVGFAVTERVVASAGDITRLDIVRHAAGIEAQCEVSAELAAAAVNRGRRLPSRTGCGICGATSASEILPPLPRARPGVTIDAACVSHAMRELATMQPLNDATGATHAAAWAGLDGRITLVREDVGRHNALDKLVGARLRSAASDAGFVVLTSRGSYVLVQKAAMLGAPLLATVSAPTALAVRVAEECGMTLAGFVRDERMTLYTNPGRVTRAPG